MKALDKFVEVWEKTKNIEDVLSQNIVLPDGEQVQAYLSTLPEDEHRKIRKSLDEALTSLSAHTSGMEEEAESLKVQIENNIQVSNACLVYNKLPGKPRA